MKSLHLNTALAALALCAVSHPAFADVVSAFNDFGPGDSYVTSSGWTASGSTSLVGYSTPSCSFIADTTGYVTSLDLAVGYVTGDQTGGTFTLSNNGPLTSPGSTLETFDLTPSGNLGSDNAPTHVLANDSVLLTAGQRYWITLNAPSNSWYAWNNNNTGATGPVQIQYTNYAYTQTDQLGAFDIDVAAVPEASTFALFALLTVGGLLVLRRQSNRRMAQ